MAPSYQDLVRSKLELDAEEAKGNAFFFNWANKLDKLLMILSCQPKRPIVVLGSTGTGKSMLLKHAQTICHAFFPVMRIDLLGVDVSNPVALAEIVKAEVLEWLDVFLSISQNEEGPSPTVGSNIAKFACAAKVNLFPAQAIAELRREAAASSGLGQLLSSFRTANQGSFQTVIVIDGADRLKLWKGEQRQELDTLIGFFGWLTKQERCTHVLLASSDDLFWWWLHQQSEKLEYRLLGVGNFGNDEARRFFETHCFMGFSQTEHVADWRPYWDQRPDGDRRWHLHAAAGSIRKRVSSTRQRPGESSPRGTRKLPPSSRFARKKR